MYTTTTTTRPTMLPRTADGLHLYRVDDTAHGTLIVFHDLDAYVKIDDVPEFVSAHPRKTRHVYVRIGSILSRDTSNEKQAKTAAKFANVLSLIYYGAPASRAGFGIQACSHHTVECVDFCLESAGNGSITQTILSRIGRQRVAAFAPVYFWDRFERELQNVLAIAERSGKKLYIRPNGITDTWCQQLRSLIVRHPQVGWYDYTAVPSRLDHAESLKNYDVTFSVKETRANHLACRAAFDRGYNLAAVVTADVKQLLLRLDGFVDFDSHDLRIPAADGVGVVGLLTPKGRLRGKTTDRTGRPSMVFNSVNSIRSALGV